jgi:hypothetical protein
VYFFPGFLAGPAILFADYRAFITGAMFKVGARIRMGGVVLGWAHCMNVMGLRASSPPLVVALVVMIGVPW